MAETSAFDAVVDRAWRELRTALAEHLATMEGDDVLIVGAATADLARLTVSVDFWVSGDDLVCFARCVGVDDDALLTVLARADGWVPPESHDPDTMVLELARRDADHAAAATVTMLRDIAGLPHPCFAQARTSVGPYVLTPVMAEPAMEPDNPAVHRVEYPTNSAELHDCVARALAWKFSGTVVDGGTTFPVVLSGHPSYVTPDPEAPQVRIFVPLVVDVSDRTRAAEVLMDLNSQLDFIRLTLTTDQVNAVIDLPAQPFSAEHLGDHLDRMSEFLRRLDPHFPHKLGGRFHRDATRADSEPDLEPDPEPFDDDDDLPEGLLTLIRLNPSGTEQLDPHQIAEVCGYDRDTILEYLRISEEQVLEWRDSAALVHDSDILDDDELELCEHEVAGWEYTAESLREALRVLTHGAHHQLFDPPPPEQPGSPD